MLASTNYRVIGALCACWVCRFPCGGQDTGGDAPAWHCPVGSGDRLPVGVGNYSTPEAAPVHQRSGQAVCEPGRYCVGGVAVSGRARFFLHHVHCVHVTVPVGTMRSSHAPRGRTALPRV